MNNNSLNNSTSESNYVYLDGDRIAKNEHEILKTRLLSIDEAMCSPDYKRIDLLMFIDRYDELVLYERFSIRYYVPTSPIAFPDYIQFTKSYYRTYEEYLDYKNYTLKNKTLLDILMPGI